MFWVFVAGALKLRSRRLALAAAAMAVAGALATAMFTVYGDVEKKISAQFQAYGANALIAPRAGAVTVPLRAAAQARSLGATAVPFLYVLRSWQGKPVVVAGIDQQAGASLLQYWHVEGTRGDCLAGLSLGAKLGDTLGLGDFSCAVNGIVSTGGAEDNQIILPFATVAGLAQSSGSASLIQIRMPVDRLDLLRRAVPEVEVRLVRAVAETESNVVLKVRVALFLLMAVILAIVTLSVSSNFGELVMERAKEIGILKAIGAGEPKIAAFFVAEALVVAAFSTAVGYAAGVVLAGWIDRSVFDAAFSVHVSAKVFGISALVTALVALAATALAAGSIWRIQPAVILRGE